jgi:hypothetical protein
VSHSLLPLSWLLVLHHKLVKMTVQATELAYLANANVILVTQILIAVFVRAQRTAHIMACALMALAAVRQNGPERTVV